MKLIRFGNAGQELPGVLSPSGRRLDCSKFGQDWDSAFLASDGLQRLAEWLRKWASDCPEISDYVRLGPPVTPPSKIICVGLNYATHARESGMEVPSEPVLFMKATSSLSGPNDDIVIPQILSASGSPRLAQETDWEVELAVVIGRQCKSVKVEDAMHHVAGYTLHNDVSERETQLQRGGQWVKGKSFDSFAPIGPWLATADEIPDPQNLRLWLKLNGELMQNDNTCEMIFKIPQLISYISWHMRLLPGDIISTGTPFGVGLGLSPKRYLRAGDKIELGIDGLGTARQRVIAASMNT